MIDIMKLDDKIYVEQGFRKEQIDKAIEKYGLDKRRDLGGIGNEEEDII